MSLDAKNVITLIAVAMNVIAMLLNSGSALRTHRFFNATRDEIGKLKKELLESQQQLAFYKSRCYGAEKKNELLEEEITKLRIKK